MSTPAGVWVNGSELLRLRYTEWLSQSELAARVGVSTVHYRAVETRRSKASMTMLANLADMLGVAPLTLVADVDKDRVRL